MINDSSQRRAAVMAFITITEVSQADAFVGDLFRRKFGGDPPDFPHHFVAFYHGFQGYIPVSYLHAWKYRQAYLIGGGCTDGNAIRACFSAEHQASLGQSPGLLYYMLRHAFDTLAGDCKAFFGHCGDARAMEVDLAAGFRPTPTDPRLLIHTATPISTWRERYMTRYVAALGAF